MDKQIVPIFIDSAYDNDIYYEAMMHYKQSFKFSIFISSASMEGLDAFTNCIYIYIIIILFILLI